MTVNPKMLEWSILAAGLVHLAITSAGLTMTLVLDWRRSLAPLCALTRHIIWTHGAFVLLTIVGFGVVSLMYPGALASGDPLARAVCGFIAAFWLIRLFIGFFLFDAKPHLTSAVLKVCYHSLTVVFLFFVVCYGAAAVG